VKEATSGRGLSGPTIEGLLCKHGGRGDCSPHLIAHLSQRERSESEEPIWLCGFLHFYIIPNLPSCQAPPLRRGPGPGPHRRTGCRLDTCQFLC